MFATATARKSALQGAVRNAALWIVFFAISAGLGYPTLNRYDPRQKLPDAGLYARMATNGPAAVETHVRFRVLVPYISGRVYTVAMGHTGSWDPLAFSFLFVNACFVATTAYLILRLGVALLHEPAVALLAATLYLLNFAVANAHLAMLVDSAEACLLMAIVASVYYRCWVLLPVIGILGSLAKESFVPFSITMALGCHLASNEKKRGWSAAWIAAMAALEFTTLIILQSEISGRLVMPWNFASVMNSPTSYASNLWHSLLDRESWYILIWLLPLGLAGTKRLPREWKAASGAGVAVAIILNAYHSTVGGGGGGLGRYVFDIAGPMLSLSAAAFLTTWWTNGNRDRKCVSPQLDLRS